MIEVIEKLSHLFSNCCLTFLKVTGSKDLIKADMSNCSSVLDLLDGPLCQGRENSKKGSRCCIRKCVDCPNIVNSIIAASSNVELSHVKSVPGSHGISSHPHHSKAVLAHVVETKRPHDFARGMYIGFKYLFQQ